MKRVEIVAEMISLQWENCNCSLCRESIECQSDSQSGALCQNQQSEQNGAGPGSFLRKMMRK